MNERAVHNQRDGHRDVQQREAVEQEHPRPLRWRSHPVKSEQEQHQPQNRVDSLDGKFGHSEDQREERDVACHRKGPEGTEVPSVLECNQAERDDYKEDGLLVDMPPEEERSVPTQGQRTYKGIPVRTEPEFDQGELRAR